MDIHRVSATLVGTELSAGFTSSALKPGDPGQTSVSGLVLDNQDQPLANVTLRIDGTTREAKTNDQGQFKITNTPVGPVHLIADPSTTTAPGEWPTLSYNLVTVAGADNPLSGPIYLVKLDTEHAVRVGTEDATITLPEVPGFKLSVKKGSVTFPNGAREGLLSVTPVNSTAVPMTPPNGMQPQFIVTIQPTGAMFDPPAALSLPNVDGHKPGAEVEMYSYDHDLEEFVAIGLGTVTADGSVIESNPGVGVIKAGWHCGSQPNGQACAENCGCCKKCNGFCNCANDADGPNKCLEAKGLVCTDGAKAKLELDTKKVVDWLKDKLGKVARVLPLPEVSVGSAIEEQICPTCCKGKAEKDGISTLSGTVTASVGWDKELTLSTPENFGDTLDLSAIPFLGGILEFSLSASVGPRIQLMHVINLTPSGGFNACSGMNCVALNGGGDADAVAESAASASGILKWTSNSGSEFVALNHTANGTGKVFVGVGFNGSYATAPDCGETIANACFKGIGVIFQLKLKFPTDFGEQTRIWGNQRPIFLSEPNCIVE